MNTNELAGWKTVPIGSTSPMNNAGLAALPDGCMYADVERCYLAMLATAPVPPAPQAAPVLANLTDDQIRTLWQQSWEVALKDAGFCIGNGDVAHMNQPIVFARAILAARGQS